MAKQTRDGDELVKEVFGASLYQQGRAFYVALEFLAIVRGASAAGQTVLPPPGEPVRYARRSHDFARRILTGEEATGTPAVTKTLRALLRGLTVPVPGRRSTTVASWSSEHMYPYVGDLVHYDAVRRPNKKRIWVERYTYRGGGGLAHKIVRTDPNEGRLAETRAALTELMKDSDTALGRIARALAAHDDAETEQTAEPWLDESEMELTRISVETPWIELLRSGIHRIVTRPAVPNAERIEALMHWIPFCIAMHQLVVARETCGSATRGIPVDFRAGANPVRKLAREAAKSAQNEVYRALEHAAVTAGKQELLKTKAQTWRAGPRTFLTTTLGGVGALNDIKGTMFFRFGTELIQALVLATVDREIEFERFCRQVLYERLGFVVDGESAKASGLANQVDSAHFQSNADAFAEFLRELGLLRDYSDATRMVRAQLW